MNLSVEEIKQTILPILRRYGVTRAAVFGSAVTGRLRPDSDIDILVRIGEDLPTIKDALMRVHQDLANDGGDVQP